MKGSVLSHRALTFLTILTLVILSSGAAFAVLGAFTPSYGGGFTLTPQTTIPTNVDFNAKAVGLASFGNSTLVIHATFDTSINPNPINGGNFVLTAPNGDQAYGILTGVANTIDAAGYSKMRGNYKFTGGTGKFSTVKGSGTWTGLSRTDGAVTRGLLQISFNGTIGN